MLRIFQMLGAAKHMADKFGLPSLSNLPKARHMDALVKLAYRLDRLIKRVMRATQHGVQAIALVPDGRIILVSLRYLGGWHLPGGGARRNESSVDAVLREMREETAMLSYGRLTSLGMVHEISSGVSTNIEVFLIEGVELGPQSGGNFEVRTVALWHINDLPAKCAVARARLARFGLAQSDCAILTHRLDGNRQQRALAEWTSAFPAM